MERGVERAWTTVTTLTLYRPDSLSLPRKSRLTFFHQLFRRNQSPEKRLRLKVLHFRGSNPLDSRSEGRKKTSEATCKPVRSCWVWLKHAYEYALLEKNNWFDLDFGCFRCVRHVFNDVSPAFQLLNNYITSSSRLLSFFKKPFWASTLNP